jgi:hypothetical protein
MFMTNEQIAWLNSHDELQMGWAWRYFGSQLDLPERTSDAPKSLLLDWLTQLQNNAENRELLRKARNAWRQKECRHKDGRKAYNFILPKTAHANLKTLARLRNKATMTAALDELIREGLEAEKRHKSEMKTLQEKHKSSLDDLKRLETERKGKTEFQIKKLTDVIQNHSHAAKELGTELTELLRSKCRIELGIIDEPASDEDQVTLDRLHKQELSKIKLRLPFANRLLAFSSRPFTYKGR